MKLVTSFAVAATVALSAGLAKADVIISNNSAAIGNGPITTINFTTATPVGSFVPQGAQDGSPSPPFCPSSGCNGRGLALVANQFYYTELDGGFGPSDGIHIAPYNGGAGGADTGFAPNPIAGTGISDLAVDPDTGNLWVLAGYPGVGSAFLLNGATLALISGPVTLQGLNSGTDGFTVLPNALGGTSGVPAGAKFVANLGDAENNYVYFDASGNALTSPFQVPSSAVGGPCGSATGVDIAPDAKSLYFECDFNSIVQTDFAGNFLGSAPIAGLGEDIAVQQPFICVGDACNPTGVPEPASFTLLGVAMAGMGAALRRR